MIKQFLLRLFHQVFFAEGYFENSQHVYRDFTMIALDQSDSTTQLCHVRISVHTHKQSGVLQF